MLIILVLKWRQKDYYGFKANLVSTVSLNLANILKKIFKSSFGARKMVQSL